MILHCYWMVKRLPYLRSRISGAGAGITSSVVGIPHDPTPEADGTSFSTAVWISTCDYSD